MSHRLGQVFLKDNNIIQKILTLSNIKPNDHVVEIGCGSGAITIPISQQVNQCMLLLECQEKKINNFGQELIQELFKTLLLCLYQNHRPLGWITNN